MINDYMQQKTLNIFLATLAGVATLIVGVMPVVAEEMRYRMKGDEYIEAAVMESRVVVDVQRAGFYEGDVVSVLYGTEVLGFEVRENAPVRIEYPKNYKLPLYEQVKPRYWHKAPLVQDDEGFHLQTNQHRVLFFLQENPEISSYRYSEFKEVVKIEQPSLEIAISERLRQQVILGSQAFSWFGIAGYEVSRGTFDALWRLLYVVEDVLEPKQTRIYENLPMLEELYYEREPGNFIPKARRYRLTEKKGPRIMWPTATGRVVEAAKVHRSFENAKYNTRDEREKLTFYAGHILDESVYANYALAEMRKLNSDAAAAKLMEIIPNLTNYSGEAWESVIRIMSKGKPDEIYEQLLDFVELIEQLASEHCFGGTQKTDFEIPADARLILSHPGLGLIGFEKLREVVNRLYDAELQCFLVSQKLEVKNLEPGLDRSLIDKALSLGTNSGLSIDEIGLLDEFSPFSPGAVRLRQKELARFEPAFTTTLLKKMATVPTMLREMVDHCGFGLNNYIAHSFPNRLKSNYYLWLFSCIQLRDYDFLQVDCTTDDFRQNIEFSQYLGLLAQMLVKAIKQYDAPLVYLSMDILEKAPAREVARVITYVLKETRKDFKNPTRYKLLAELSRVPYHSIVESLGEEYSYSKKDHRLKLDEALMSMLNTTLPGASIPARRWLGYLSAIQSGKMYPDGSPVEELGVFSNEKLREVIERKACTEYNIGWAGRWKRQKVKLRPTDKSQYEKPDYLRSSSVPEHKL